MLFPHIFLNVVYQDNYTIQLTGTKRWTVAASGISNPITNCHPATAALTALANDIKVTRAHSASALPPPPDVLASGSTTFVLRPGSTMYLPAGVWHRVEAEEETGSLSINFSLAPQRWADLLAARIAPVLWNLPRWRAPIVCGSTHDETRATLNTMLPEAAAAITSLLDAQVLLPDGLIGNSRVVTLPASKPGTSHDSELSCRCQPPPDKLTSGARSRRGSDVNAGSLQSLAAVPGPLTILTRSVASTLVFPLPHVETQVHLPPCPYSRVRAQVCAGFGLGGTGGAMTSDFEVIIDVPARLGGLLKVASSLSPGETILAHMLSTLGCEKVDDVESGSIPKSRKRRRSSSVDDDAAKLISILVYNGYFLASSPPTASETGLSVHSATV